MVGAPRTPGGVASFLLFLVAFPLFAQRGAITRLQNLGELTEEAAIIVRGKVASARVEPHPQFRNLTTVVVTLRVEETLKGKTDDTYTFRQYVWDARDRLAGLAYRKGQHVLLLLTAPSAQGLSSPVGLEQGRFQITRDAEGLELATNGYSNAGLLCGLATHATRKGIPLTEPQARMAAEHRRGPLRLDELRGLIRQFVGGQP